MRTSGIFTTHQFNIEVKEIGKTIIFIPFGDVHKESPLHSPEHWKRFLDWAKKKKDAYWLGMGDYCELSSASERQILSDKKLHETTASRLESFYLDMTRNFAKDIEFMRGRLIGILGGNHYSMLAHGADTDQELARIMGTTYLGVCSLIRLSFNYHGMKNSVDIFAHHGKGGGMLVGSKLNNVQKMAEIARANIYLMGDIHAKVLGDSQKFQLTSGGGKLRMKKIKEIYCRTGSFAKGYIENVPSYVTDKLLAPSDLGVVKIEMTPYREGAKNREFFVDIHASI